MLDLSRIQGAPVFVEYAIAATFNPAESGLAMVRVVDSNGLEAIQPSAGTSADASFLGSLALDKHAAVNGTRVQYPLQVPASGTLAVVIPDSIGVANLKVELYTAGVWSTCSGSDYSLSGNVLTFTPSGYANLVVYVSYNYTLTDFQKMQLGISPIPSASAFIRKAAVLQGRCRIYVTNFIPNAAYTVDCDLYTQAGGYYGTASTSTCKAGKCVSTPTAIDPFLGIEYSV